MEIVGLCKSTVRWLAELCDQKKFPYAGVSKLQDGIFFFIHCVRSVFAFAFLAIPGCTCDIKVVPNSIT